MTVGVRWLATGPGSGFGDASQAYMSGLRAGGVPVTWTPLGWPSESWQAPYGPASNVGLGDAPNADVARRQIEHDTVVVHSTPLWHERLAEEAAGKRLVAFTAWETDRVAPEEVRTLDHYDVVLVPSTFNVEVMTSSGVQPPVRAVPHIARDLPAAPAGSAGDPFRFCVIATWTSRKAVLDTVEAYLRAFTGAEAVSLTIHTTPEDLVAVGRRVREGAPDRGAAESTWFSLARAVAGRADVAEIRLSTRLLSQAELDRMHAQHDCLVSLSRGEAWGLTAFDAATTGRPVIASSWGATKEFLPSGYPYLVDYRMVPTTDDPPDAWWTPRPGEMWAKIDIDHAAQTMRQVFEDRLGAAGWGARARQHVLTTYSGPLVTARLVETMRQL